MVQVSTCSGASPILGGNQWGATRIELGYQGTWPSQLAGMARQERGLQSKEAKGARGPGGKKATKWSQFIVRHPFFPLLSSALQAEYTSPSPSLWLLEIVSFVEGIALVFGCPQHRTDPPVSRGILSLLHTFFFEVEIRRSRYHPSSSRHSFFTRYISSSLAVSHRASFLLYTRPRPKTT